MGHRSAKLRPATMTERKIIYLTVHIHWYPTLIGYLFWCLCRVAFTWYGLSENCTPALLTPIIWKVLYIRKLKLLDNWVLCHINERFTRQCFWRTWSQEDVGKKPLTRIHNATTETENEQSVIARQPHDALWLSKAGRRPFCLDTLIQYLNFLRYLNSIGIQRREENS